MTRMLRRHAPTALPAAAPHPALSLTRRGARPPLGPLVLLLVLVAALTLLAVVLVSAPAMAQSGAGTARAAAMLNGQDPAQDIFIEGLGFSKLALELQADAELQRNASYLSLAPLLEKNLCWSGVFNLTGGRTQYCRLEAEPSRVDMRLAMRLQDNAMVLRLHDAGPEALLLDEEVVRFTGEVNEETLMEVVNRLTERITGQPGLLGSSIGFVLHQPGFAKVVVATTTHGRKLRPLSHNPDINILPRFRPDGLGMVYTVLGDQGTRVFYQNLAEDVRNNPASRFLTPPGSLNTGGTFSPDGLTVAITMSVNQNADLYAVDVRTGNKRALTSRLGIETQAHWSPDGKRLVFVSDRSGTPQIYLLDLETGEDLRLTFESSYNADPRWSPDGKSILFTRRVRGSDQIHIMDQYGENVRPVTFGRYDAEQAEWSPDGRQVVFASNRTGEFKLYVVSADGTGLRRLTHTPERYGENSPTWTSRRLVR